MQNGHRVGDVDNLDCGVRGRAACERGREKRERRTFDMKTWGIQERER